MSALVARSPRVEAVLAIEIVEQVAILLSSRTAAHVLGDLAFKVVPVIGSFQDIRLPDGSVDFVIETHSLHHFPDLIAAFREAARVLRRSGTMLCFDRVQLNSMTDAEVDRQLSRV